MTATLAVLLSATAATVYASTIYWIATEEDSYGRAIREVFLSCGSSAGDYIYSCPVGGGQCADEHHGDLATFLCGD